MGRGVTASVKGGGGALYHFMIEVDDSKLTNDDREFLQTWANALEVRIEVLVLRIVQAAVDGDQYVEMRPE